MKGRSDTNSLLAIAAAAALLAGATALSLTDPVHDVAAPGDFIDRDGDDIQIDEPALNRTVNTGGLEGLTEQASEDGIINSLAEDLAQLISGEEIKPDTSENTSDTETDEEEKPPPDEPEPPENMTEPVPEEPGLLNNLLNSTSELINFEDEEVTEEEESRTETEGLLPEIPDGLFKALLLLITGLAAIALYRSDVDTKKLLKQMARKLSELIKAGPDIFRRLIVNTATLLSNTAHRVLKTAGEFAKRPLATAGKIRKGLGKRTSAFYAFLLSLRKGGWKRKVREALPVKEEPEHSLEYVWRLLKMKAGVENDNTYTPLEVGGLALEQDLDRETVSDIVEAYRLEQYSSEGYTGELEITEWRRFLSDEDE